MKTLLTILMLCGLAFGAEYSVDYKFAVIQDGPYEDCIQVDSQGRIEVTFKEYQDLEKYYRLKVIMPWKEQKAQLVKALELASKYLKNIPFESRYFTNAADWNDWGDKMKKRKRDIEFIKKVLDEAKK